MLHRYPLAVCGDLDWIDRSEIVRLAHHAHHIWAPLANEKNADTIWCVTEGTTPHGTPVDDGPIRRQAVHLILVRFSHPRCAPGSLAYLLGPPAARILLQHAFPVELRVDALLQTLEQTGDLRIQHRWVSTVNIPVPQVNPKQSLPEGTLRTAALVLLLYVVCLIAVVR
jgi:hypothetical protein